MRRASFFGRLFHGKSATIRNYEKVLIEAVVDSLPQSTGSKLLEQMRLLPFLQRYEGKSLMFYPDRGNTLPTSLLFRTSNPEFVFAKVDFLPQTGEGTPKLTARFYAVHQRFYSIDLDKDGKSVRVNDREFHSISIVQIITSDPDEDGNSLKAIPSSDEEHDGPNVLDLIARKKAARRGDKAEYELREVDFDRRPRPS